MMLMPVTMPGDNGASITYAQPAPRARSEWSGTAFNLAHLFEASLRQRLDELKSLPAGWDGEGAEPISAVTLQMAQVVGVRLLDRTPPPEITPNAGDTLTLEWESDAGSALLEIGHTDIQLSDEDEIWQAYDRYGVVEQHQRHRQSWRAHPVRPVLSEAAHWTGTCRLK